MDSKALICLGGEKFLIGFHLVFVHELFSLGLGCIVQNVLRSAVL